MSSRDFYEGIAVSVLMTMRNDILSLDDFGAVMSRLQNVPPGIQMQHMIARAKAMAVTGLLKYDETDGMKIFTSRKPPHRSSPNRLVVPHIRGKAPPSVQTIARWDSDASVDGSIDSLSVQADDDDDDAREAEDTSSSRPASDAIERVESLTLRVASPTTTRRAPTADDDDPFTGSIFAATPSIPSHADSPTASVLRETSSRINDALGVARAPPARRLETRATVRALLATSRDISRASLCRRAFAPPRRRARRRARLVRPHLASRVCARARRHRR